MPDSISCSVHDSPHRLRLVDDVRNRLFTPGGAGGVAGNHVDPGDAGSSGGSSRIGAEVELIPLRSDDGRPVPILADDSGPGMLSFLKAHGASRGWFVRPGPHGVGTVVTPDGGAISFEPGGQIEYATRPNDAVDGLVADLAEVIPPLVEAAAEAGIRLVGAGIDPVNPLRQARLRLPGERYTAMHRYLSGISDAGPRMMLQSAAIQVNVDLGAPGTSAALRWRVLNASAPYTTAIFANSGVYEETITGFASYRARQWRLLDRRRTGVLGREDDMVGEYTDFALNAGWIFGPTEEPAEPFLEWLLKGQVSMDDWRRHLTTLFPEVRPRGFLEIRSIDALSPDWYAAPLVFLAGLVADDAVLRQASEIAGEPDSQRLQDAARAGMSDPRIAGPARELFALALESCERNGLAPRSLPTAREFCERYTYRGRAPADDEVDAAA